MPITEPSYHVKEKHFDKLFRELAGAPGYKSGIINQMLAIERFETTLGVYNHGHKDSGNPCPLSTHHEVSQTIRDSVAARKIRTLLLYKVPQKTGLSITELFNLNTESFRLIVNQCRHMEITTRGATNITDDLEQL